MKQMNIALVVPLLLLYACSGGSADDSTQAPSADSDRRPEKPIDEDQLMLRLSADMVAEPQTQAQRDQNTIINYALDSLLDLQSTASGLYYQILREGEGPKIDWGDRIRVHYRGYFPNGKVFDSSYRRNEPLEFYVGNMIDSWNEGLQLVRVGSKARLLSPSHLAYGEEGLKDRQDRILAPPNQVLIFELEVLEMVRKGE